MEATRPARLACGFEATLGGGAFYGKTYSFDALSLTARSSFDSFDASSARSMLFASSASNDCECTNTLAHKGSETWPLLCMVVSAIAGRFAWARLIHENSASLLIQLKSAVKVLKPAHIGVPLQTR